jgi:hypothetical protein
MRVGALPLPADLDRESTDGDRRPARAARATSPKWPAALLSIVVLTAVLLPVTQNWAEVPRDDFPLSYYPMFSFEKGDRQRVTYLVTYDGAMNRFLLPYWYAGTGGMNQVRRQINKQVDRGQASRLCRNVASRVARAGDLPDDLNAVQIVTGTFFMSQFFAGNRVPASETVRAQCPVQRG